MLDRTDFASCQQRIRLYCQGKENGVNILKSIHEGPFRMGTLRETQTEGAEGSLHLGTERPRVYSDLISEEKDRNQATIQDGKVVIQNVQGQQDRGQRNNARGSGAAGYGGAQNRVGYANPEYFKDKMLLMQAQENGVTLDEEYLLFIAGGQDNVVDDDVDEQPIQDLALNVDNVFQADDYDAFDSDVDEAPTAQNMFMANLSSADPVYDNVGPSFIRTFYLRHSAYHYWLSMEAHGKNIHFKEQCPLTRFTHPKVVPAKQSENVSTSKSVIIENSSHASQKPLTRYQCRNKWNKAVPTGIPTPTDATMQSVVAYANQPDSNQN
nr:hypothetical protein [Tanacetum cinerariifolium]